MDSTRLPVFTELTLQEYQAIVRQRPAIDVALVITERRNPTYAWRRALMSLPENVQELERLRLLHRKQHGQPGEPQ